MYRNWRRPVPLSAEKYKDSSVTEYRMEGQLWADKNMRGGGVMNIEAGIGEDFRLVTAKIRFGEIAGDESRQLVGMDSPQGRGTYHYGC